MLDYLPDLAADFRVFYRIDDFRLLDGPTFFSLAFRTPHYGGAIRGALTAIVRDESGTPPSGSSEFERHDLSDL